MGMRLKAKSGLAGLLALSVAILPLGDALGQAHAMRGQARQSSRKGPVRTFSPMSDLAVSERAKDGVPVKLVADSESVDAGLPFLVPPLLIAVYSAWKSVAPVLKVGAKGVGALKALAKVVKAKLEVEKKVPANADEVKEFVLEAVKESVLEFTGDAVEDLGLEVARLVEAAALESAKSYVPNMAPVVGDIAELKDAWDTASGTWDLLNDLWDIANLVAKYSAPGTQGSSQGSDTGGSKSIGYQLVSGGIDAANSALGNIGSVQNAGNSTLTSNITTTVSGSELVTNPEFTNGLYGWQSHNAFVTDSFGPVRADGSDPFFGVVHTGFGTADNSGFIEQTVVVPGSRRVSYDIVWGYATATNPGPGWVPADFRLVDVTGMFTITNEQRRQIAFYYVPTGLPSAFMNSADGIVEWQSINGTAVLQKGIYRIRFNSCGACGSGTNAIFADRFRVR